MHVIVAEEMVAEAAALRQRQPAAMEEEEEERAVAGGAVAELRPGGRAGGGGVRVRARHRAGVPCPLSGQTGAIIGSTAVVALLVRDRLVVSNCGDSRAVLCRAGDPLPLSSDHKVISPSIPTWHPPHTHTCPSHHGFDRTCQNIPSLALPFTVDSCGGWAPAEVSPLRNLRGRGCLAGDAWLAAGDRRKRERSLSLVGETWIASPCRARRRGPR
ncbi:Os04g0167900 [Oryza sativa Japonica Group]|uniref:protein-serine/threonine phosphatase n=1 Tax=Oryza sativa subsp. japonica TaxID=39947 RepID=A0A0P0W6Q9_ORYSJ|nr:Os04g0167900 [Oryza sativa Japonica Group]